MDNRAPSDKHRGLGATQWRRDKVNFGKPEGESWVAKTRRLSKCFGAIIAAVAIVSLQTGCLRAPEPHVVPPPEAVGWVISFAGGGGSEPYRVSGWSRSEPDYTWTDGTSATLALPIPVLGTPYIMRMKLGSFVFPPDLPAQDVDLFVNGRRLARWSVSGTGDFQVVIPRELTSSTSTLEVELQIPHATSPKAIGQSADERLLGLRCYSLELKRT